MKRRKIYYEEYYQCVNLDKKEFIHPGDFDISPLPFDLMRRWNRFLKALYELFEIRWGGDDVIFLSDKKDYHTISNDRIRKKLIESEAFFPAKDGNLYWNGGSYHNISGSFWDADENQAIEEDTGDLTLLYAFGIYEPGEPVWDQYLREGKAFEYTVNHTKKEYYSLTDIDCIRIEINAENRRYLDPLPFLLGCGNVIRCSKVLPEKSYGSWIGDDIHGMNEAPDGYRLIRK